MRKRTYYIDCKRLYCHYNIFRGCGLWRVRAGKNLYNVVTRHSYNKGEYVEYNKLRRAKSL